MCVSAGVIIKMGNGTPSIENIVVANIMHYQNYQLPEIFICFSIDKFTAVCFMDVI